MPFRSGDGETVEIGYINHNNQMCLGTRGVPGTDHLQLSYRMICLEENCEIIYGRMEQMSTRESVRNAKMVLQVSPID